MMTREERRAYDKWYYRRTRRNGLCVRCRKNKTEKSRCDSCARLERNEVEKAKLWLGAYI